MSKLYIHVNASRVSLRIRSWYCKQGLTSLSVGKNYFVSPAAYSTESGERATKQTVSENGGVWPPPYSHPDTSLQPKFVVEVHLTFSDVRGREV